jgi:hypothetical protein
MVWFAMAVKLLLELFDYLRYTTHNTIHNHHLLVKTIKGGMLSELSAFADLGMGGYENR